jgi:hypothetical protein
MEGRKGRLPKGDVRNRPVPALRSRVPQGGGFRNASQASYTRHHLGRGSERVFQRVTVSADFATWRSFGDDTLRAESP